MTIRRLSAGLGADSGIQYLLKSIAVGDGPEGADLSDLTRYYTETGTPPGVFLGAGLAGLNVVDGVALGVAAGSAVTGEHLERMLGKLVDPITGEPLGGRRRAFKEELDRKKWDASRQPLGGFDLTFSPSKSVSTVWALADPATRETIYRCHQEAIAKTLAYAEREVFHSRSGHNGNVQEDILGVVAASFTHFDSRAGDPQLHDHVVVWNKAQSVRDGEWRTLDSRGIYKAVVMLSELHQGVLSDLLTKELGWDWEGLDRQDSTVKKWEVKGVWKELMDEFSQRTAAIIEEKDELIKKFVAREGRRPTNVEILRMRQAATLSTRQPKQGHSLGSLTKSWVERATPFLEDTPTAWVASLTPETVATFTRADFTDEILADLATSVLEVVGGKRPTFSRDNLSAEALRQIHGSRFVTYADRIAVMERTTELASGQALLLTTPDLYHVPEALRRDDGTSRFRAKGHDVFTSRVLLEAEDRLIASGRSVTGPVTSKATVAAIASELLPGKTFRLSIDQALAVEQVATSGRNLDVLVGPAGTGKSTALAGLRAMWEHDHGQGSVVGLAPSAAAATVLAEELGIATDNVSMWLTRHRENATRWEKLKELRAAEPEARSTRAIRELEAQIMQWSFQPGQLVMVDEASLAPTFALDELMSAANDSGAKVVLIGDWAQLSSVEAGGMFRTLANDRGTSAPTLTDVRRFKADWEKKASLQLRTGRVEAVSAYATHDRITAGRREHMMDALYVEWRRDSDAGLTSLMVAGDATTVRELNVRARRDRVLAGHVVADGVNISHEMVAGVNDRVVTRENRRNLSAGGHGWVKNGDVWTVTETRDDGSMKVQRVGGNGWVVLPADYVRENVELAYASTAHRAQGRTVDTAHAFVDATSSREVLYVSATRGKDSNRLYVDTFYDPDPSTSHDGLTPLMSASEVLEGVLRTEMADVSATDSQQRELAKRDSIPILLGEYNSIANLAQGERWNTVLTNSGLTAEQLAQVKSSDAFGALTAALRDADARGAGIEDVFEDLVMTQPLGDAEDIASVLHYRVDRYVEIAGYGRAVNHDLVAGLFPRALGIEDPDMAQALLERDVAMEQRAFTLAEQAIEERAPWVVAIGDPPTDADDHEVWLAKVATVAAYRDYWGIVGTSPVGDPVDQHSIQQLGHYRRALAALEAVHIDAAAMQPSYVGEYEPYITPDGPGLSL